MELLEEENYKEQSMKSKKISKIILIIIFILIIAVIGVVFAIYYLKASAFKVTLDGKNVSIPEEVFIIDKQTGKVYVDIKAFASYVGYTSHDGEYKVYSQDTNKCYVESKDETASFFLNSSRISKVAPNSNQDYEDYIISEPVKKENGKLFVISEGIEKACNLTFSYNKAENSIKIYTLPYLVEYYNQKIIKLGYAGISQNFNNQKAILYDIFVVQELVDNKEGRYGVIDINNNEIIALRYKNIQFSEYNKEFLVTNNESKTGIMLSNGDTKVKLEYDDIKIIDRELELYLVKNNNKYGVINNEQQYIIHMEYDMIGIDTASYPSNKIGNKYLLFDNVIPVKQANKWGLFNKNGDKILNVEYDSIGCIASTVKDKVVNNLIIVPDIEAIVVCKDKKYGLITSTGVELLPCALNVMYSIIDAGIEDYFMTYTYMDEENKPQEITYNIIEYLKMTNIIKEEDTKSQNQDYQDNKNTQTNGQNVNNIASEQVNEQNNNVTVQSQINDIVL